MNDIKRPTAEVKADRTTAAARAIIEAEKKVRDANMARLRAARLAREAEESPAAPPERQPARRPKSKTTR